MRRPCSVTLLIGRTILSRGKCRRKFCQLIGLRNMLHSDYHFVAGIVHIHLRKDSI